MGGVLLIPVTINGQRTEFLFDSGAAITGINQKYVDYFGIESDPIRKVRIMAAHYEPIYSPMGRAKEIRVGGITRKNLSVLIISFPPGAELHGLIGMNFLKGLRFTVEMDTGNLILRELKKT